MCAIVIRDNGMGIPEEDTATIFERFVRVHAHLDRSHGVTGTGLGLAIVAECVRELGGSIECRSSLGVGTTFVVRLPLKPPGFQTTARRSETPRNRFSLLLSPQVQLELLVLEADELDQFAVELMR